MFHIVLVEPEIPPNTGNIIRLSANTGTHLHLVRPLGFPLDDARMRRAGLDYHEWADMLVHDSLAQALDSIGGDPARRYALTTRGSVLIGERALRPGDVFVFGRETAGLSDEQLQFFPPDQRVRLPMRPQQRSLNLSNAVAVTVFEAWRQAGYAGGI
ncbi:tRNA (cytidine(34)-2'-O)-methyltransferase [Castellaniella sp.]|uniref:tRNA (cytidine(34)-2'-O)-methyltransferase n=1 Tax=Castellaniella sp. TaxID=1955812 RepID=UPI002AFDDDF3|nr:tRNA (cytidine(34)-2'-O)-methyltransferase [Castellaniella sp.]